MGEPDQARQAAPPTAVDATRVILALIAAAGSVGTAYVAVLVQRTRTAVNGHLRELEARVELLEELLRWARGREGLSDPLTKLRPPGHDAPGGDGQT